MKRPRTLGARFVETVNKPGRYGDGRGGHGLSLLVKPMANGRLSKSWSQRIRIGDDVTNIGLGAYPVVTLATARQRALDNRRSIAEGIDPRERSQGIPTFAEAVDAVISLHGGTWRDRGRSEAIWRSSLGNYAMPRLGRKKVSEIKTADVLAVLIPIWNTKRETARRVRQRIGAVMKWAIAEGHREDNPAGEAIGAALPRGGVQKRHRRALAYAEVAGALDRIQRSAAHLSTVSCFEFLVLTAARSGEARGARWTEIDLEKAVWSIPGERMKSGRDHRVPLCDRALQVLANVRPLSGGEGLVFPSPTGRVLSDNTLSKLLRDLGIDAVPHGFRSSFRQWAAERTNIPREVAEIALAHVNTDRVEAAYQRSDLFERRRDLMSQWARFLSASQAEVVPLHRGVSA